MEVDEDSESIDTPLLKCELNTLSRADGSSILCENNTMMAAAVCGPVEVKQHKMHIDKANIEVIYKPKCGQSQISDRLYESIIGRICETAVITTFYPRTAIYIIVQEMQNCGALLACSINSVCLALIHAGIAMNYLFAAVSSSISSSSETKVNSVDEKLSESRITFVFENTSENILAVDSNGKITDDEYNRCLKKCRHKSTAIFKFYKDMINKYAIKL